MKRRRYRLSQLIYLLLQLRSLVVVAIEINLQCSCKQEMYVCLVLQYFPVFMPRGVAARGIR